MKKKWLCLVCLSLLLLLPLSGLNRIAGEQLLARALTETGGACSLDTMLALGSAALGEADGSLDGLYAALTRAGLARGYAVSARAAEAAKALLAGERTLPEGYTRFTREPPMEAHVRVGSFYFYQNDSR